MQGLVNRTIEAGKKSQSEAGKQCQTEIDWNNLSMTISGPAVTLKLKNKDKKERLEPKLKFVSLIDGIVDL